MPDIEVRFNPNGNPHNDHRHVRHTSSISVGVKEFIEQYARQNAAFDPVEIIPHNVWRQAEKRNFLGLRSFPVSLLTGKDAESVTYQQAGVELGDSRIEFDPETGSCVVAVEVSARYEPAEIPKLLDNESWQDEPRDYTSPMPRKLEFRTNWVPASAADCVRLGLVPDYLYPEPVVFVTPEEYQQILAFRRADLGIHG